MYWSSLNDNFQAMRIKLARYILVRGKRTRDNMSENIFFIEQSNPINLCIRFLLMGKFLTCTYYCVAFIFLQSSRHPNNQTTVFSQGRGLFKEVVHLYLTRENQGAFRGDLWTIAKKLLPQKETIVGNTYIKFKAFNSSYRSWNSSNTCILITSFQIKPFNPKYRSWNSPNPCSPSFQYIPT